MTIPQLAALINRLYIPVKVDRDERPDVDSRYQTAVRRHVRRGWLAPHRFFAPRRTGRFTAARPFLPKTPWGVPSFRRVLESAAEAYRMRRAEVEQAAGALVSAVSQAELFEGARSSWDARLVDVLRSIPFTSAI